MYRKREGRSQALVTLTDSATKRRRDFWLGEHGRAESRELYHRVIAEWEANGRRFPTAAPCRSTPEEPAGLMLVALLRDFYRWAKRNYDKGELRSFQVVMVLMRRYNGRTPAAAFGYQAYSIPESPTPDPFPYFHVGHRYYAPSSGRFLQRDPIGIAGGRNVFTYASNFPTGAVDASGFSVGLFPGPGKKPWDPMDTQLRPRPIHQPPPSVAPVTPSPRPPQGILETPIGPLVWIHDELVLIGIALPTAVGADAFLTLTGIPW